MLRSEKERISLLLLVRLSGLSIGVSLGVIFGGGLLVLLVLGDEIVHVALGLGELHLVHSLTIFDEICFKQQISSDRKVLTGELLRDALEELLDGGGVSDEGSGHLESTWWDVANGGLDIVWNPFDEVRGVLVLNVEHLLVDFLEDNNIKDIRAEYKLALIDMRPRNMAATVSSLGGQWGESWHEEVETWEWHHVDGQLAEIGVELSWESEAGGNSGHRERNEMVQVSVCWVGELECSVADVVEGLVIDTVGLIGVLNELVDGEGGVVWLDDGVRDLW
ncbi:hypothetical protein GCK72_008862 [Caenorhabditis remanei]|uniref:Uncharacterized protein n=1 Tax=Caenorhabditis remanei TaxID=31234 RepID=A0A6A5H1Z8_CAERE|nr:hypothetical protein GCK72_008862 [Caenorhabditis remanei]KAF1760613.1 hypothetical protein GCK72_008862 [Caenorhabditis remanei]